MFMYILIIVEKYCDCFVVLYEGKLWVNGIMVELCVEFNLLEFFLDDIYFVLMKEEKVG